MNEFTILAVFGLLVVLRPDRAIRAYRRTINADVDINPRHVRIVGLVWTVAAIALATFTWMNRSR
jgi:hypothetical protein